MHNKCMLSTKDNPFNPLEDFDNWYLYDMEKGYDSCGYLMRIARLSDDFTQKESDVEIERAIDEIIKFNPLNIYIKVSKQVE